MTTSDPWPGPVRASLARPPRDAYVWVWLPGAPIPVVAGLLESDRGLTTFTYGRSYLERVDAIALYAPELPLIHGRIEPPPGLAMASCLRDAGPDAWGQRVILARHVGGAASGRDTAELDQLTYLLESGSDRIGGLDFQTSATDYRDGALGSHARGCTGLGATGERRLMVSALTMLGLDEMMARYATYVDLAYVIGARFTQPKATLRELFARIVLNVCIGNTDDHARNHAAFWDGQMLTLTPAYDLCPQVRSGEEAAQAMAISRDGVRTSVARVPGCCRRIPAGDP